MSRYSHPQLHFNPCFICSSENQKPLFKKGGWQFVSCKECGFVYVNPRLSEEDTALIYKESRWFEGKRCDDSIGKDYFTGETAYIERAKTDLDGIKNYIQRGSILDIGCGIGHFLSVAKADGWNVRGVEVSPFAGSVCKKKGLDVFIGNFNDVEYETDMFDVITASDVLEHIVDPNSFVEKVFRILKKNGIFVVSVPNVACLAARTKKSNWSQFIVPEHLNYFSSRTMELFLIKHNLKVLDIYSEPSLTLGIRKFMRNMVKKPIWLNKLLNILADDVTLFKKHLFYPPINKITKKYQIEANLLIAYALKN